MRRSYRDFWLQDENVFRVCSICGLGWVIIFLVQFLLIVNIAILVKFTNKEWSL